MPSVASFCVQKNEVCAAQANDTIKKCVEMLVMKGTRARVYLSCVLFFCFNLSLSLSSPRDTIKKRFTLMLLLAGIGSLVVIDELDVEKVHGIITHTDGGRMYFHFFSSSFSSSSSPSFLLFFFFFLDSPPPPPQTRKQPPMKKKNSIAVVPGIRAFKRGGQEGDDFASHRG